MQVVAEVEGFDMERFTPMQLDLASFDSVKSFAQELDKFRGDRPVDRLVCNAAVYQPTLDYPKWTEDDHEQQLQINYLSHFLLTSRVMPMMTDSDDARVVMIGSVTGNDNTVGGGGVYPIADLKELDGLELGAKKPIAMMDGYNFNGAKMYKDTKLALMMTTNMLHERFHRSTGISFSSIYPGCIAETPLFREKRPWFRKYFPVFMKYITGGYVGEEEAGSRLFQVLHDPACAKSGVYWSWNGGPREGRADALDTGGQITGAGGAGGGWESIFENDQSDKVLNKDLMQKLWESTNEITKAQWPKAYQSKSPCPTLKVVGAATSLLGIMEERARMKTSRDGAGAKVVADKNLPKEVRRQRLADMLQKLDKTPSDPEELAKDLARTSGEVPDTVVHDVKLEDVFADQEEAPVEAEMPDIDWDEPEASEPPQMIPGHDILGDTPVVFQPQNVMTMARAGQPLSEVATQADVFIRYKCKKGKCKTCAVNIDGKWVCANNGLGMVGFAKEAFGADPDFKVRMEREKAVQELLAQKRQAKQVTSTGGTFQLRKTKESKDSEGGEGKSKLVLPGVAMTAAFMISIIQHAVLNCRQSFKAGLVVDLEVGHVAGHDWVPGLARAELSANRAETILRRPDVRPRAVGKLDGCKYASSKISQLQTVSCLYFWPNFLAGPVFGAMNALAALLCPSKPDADLWADVELPKFPDSEECSPSLSEVSTWTTESDSESGASKQELRRRLQKGQLSRFLQLHEFQAVNRPRSCGFTLFGESKIFPIHVAAESGDYQMVRILMVSGADPESKTSKGRKAVEFARKANRDGSHEPVLCLLTGQVKIGTARELRVFFGSPQAQPTTALEIPPYRAAGCHPEGGGCGEVGAYGSGVKLLCFEGLGYLEAHLAGAPAMAAVAVVGAGRSLLLLRYLGWRGRVAFRVLCRAARDGTKRNREEAKADEDAEVEGILLELAGTARRAAESAPGDLPREAGGMRKSALLVLEILQVRFCDLLGSEEDGNFEVEDLTGRTASESLAMVAQELEWRAGLENRKIWALAARRALYVAHRVERLHYSRESDSYAVVSAAGRSRPATRPPIYITSEGSDAPESAQSDDVVAPTIGSGTTLDVASSSFGPFRLEGTTQTGAAMRSSSGMLESLPQVEEEELELAGEGEVRVAAAQHIVLQRQLLRANIRTCPAGHELQELEDRPASCDLCEEEIKGVTLCCVQCYWDICRECAGLAGLPCARKADEDVPQRAGWWMLQRQSRMLREKGDFSGAAVLLEAALAQVRPGKQDSDDRDVPEILHELGMVLKQKGHLQQAEEHLKEALRMKKSVYGGGDHVSVAVTLHELGMVLKQKGHLQQAEEYLKEALRMMTSVYAGADHVNVAGTLHELGMLLQEKGDLDQAEECFKEELRMERSVYAGADHVNLAATLHELGMLLKQKGDLDQAEECFKEELRMERSNYGGADDLNVAVTLHQLGMLLKQKGDLEQAEEHLKEALRMKKSVYGGADHDSVAVTLHQLGMLLKQKGHLQQAEEYLKEALRMMTSVYAGADHVNVAGTLHELGMLLQEKGDVDQAEEHLKEALRMKKSVYGGADHVNVAVTLHQLGMLLKQKGDLEQAEEHSFKALRMMTSVYAGADHVNVAGTLHELGMLLQEKGDVDQAEEHLKEALRMKKSVYGGADHVNVAVTLHQLGMVLKQKGDLQQAEEHLKEALRMKKSVYGGADHCSVAVTLYELGMLLKQKGDLEQAEEHLKVALRMAMLGMLPQLQEKGAASERGAEDDMSVYGGADHLSVA
ncbi:unnamed protein product [Effrenium voratum]|nr:unnamed protein product [Effrenium voratum]